MDGANPGARAVGDAKIEARRSEVEAEMEATRGNIEARRDKLVASKLLRLKLSNHQQIIIDKVVAAETEEELLTIVRQVKVEALALNRRPLNRRILIVMLLKETVTYYKFLNKKMSICQWNI